MCVWIARSAAVYRTTNQFHGSCSSLCRMPSWGDVDGTQNRNHGTIKTTLYAVSSHFMSEEAWEGGLRLRWGGLHLVHPLRGGVPRCAGGPCAAQGERVQLLKQPVRVHCWHQSHFPQPCWDLRTYPQRGEAFRLFGCEFWLERVMWR